VTGIVRSRLELRSASVGERPSLRRCGDRDEGSIISRRTCGIVGIKPTVGLVSRAGESSRSPHSRAPRDRWPRTRGRRRRAPHGRCRRGPARCPRRRKRRAMSEGLTRVLDASGVKGARTRSCPGAHRETIPIVDKCGAGDRGAQCATGRRRCDLPRSRRTAKLGMNDAT